MQNLSKESTMLIFQHTCDQSVLHGEHFSSKTSIWPDLKCEDTAPQHTPQLRKDHPVLRAGRVLIDSNILAPGLVKSDPNLCIACFPGPPFCYRGWCQLWTNKLWLTRVSQKIIICYWNGTSKISSPRMLDLLTQVDSYPSDFLSSSMVISGT